MSIIINTNISSMLGVTALNKNTNAMNKALERLSTGCRINSSKDDAAGCAISTSLTKEVSSLNVAQSNAQMGQSLIDTANGALSNMSNMLHRIRDLAEQSANGAYGDDERKAMQSEVNNLVSELYRTKNSTEFNGKNVLGAGFVTEADAVAMNYKTVHTAQELKEALVAGDADCKVMLCANIDLSELGEDWTAVGTSEADVFMGILDGNGFTISNLKINKGDTSYQGLIGYADGATIKNVSLENVDVTGKSYTGGLVGYNTASSTIENCSSSGEVTGTGNYTGGLVGGNYKSTIENCSSSGKVTGKTNVGGLVGYNNNQATIENCNSLANVTGTGTGLNGTGGLVGYNYKSTITNCSSFGTVIGSTAYTGGLVGWNRNSSTIENCNSSANVTGTSTNTGGFAGGNEMGSKIINCSSSGDTTGKRTGGFVGYSNSTIEYSKTTSKVTGTTTTGAFIGMYSGSLKQNEYNSTINDDIPAAGNKSTTEDQILDNKQLVINNKSSDIGTSGKVGAKYIGAVGSADTKCNLQVGINNDTNSYIEVDTGFSIESFDISIASETDAIASLATIDNLLAKVTGKQTELGAMSSRLDSAMQYQTIQKNTKTATNSIIKDADFAAESSNYIKQQILQQTTSSLLSTANQNPNIALMLLNSQRR